VKARTQIELLIRDLEDSSTRNQQEREELEGTLEELQADITEKEGELAKIGPDCAELVQRENEARRAMEQSEARQRSLFDKQGRASTYRNQAERDAFLRKAIDEDCAYLAKRESAREDIKRNLASAQSALQQNEKKQTESKQEIEKTRRDIQALAKETEELSGKRTALNERRKEAWKEEAKLEQTVRHANEEMKKAERVLYATMDRVSSRTVRPLVRSSVERC
jgi:structural maintenance of chromosome 3 (chondroitin sulfate proteoglycan 6)